MNAIMACLLAAILGVMLQVADALGPLTFKVECHPDLEIDRIVCFIMPIDDLVYTNMPEPGDNA